MPGLFRLRYQVLAGYVTGDPLQPIGPDSWTPAEVVAHISFDELTIWTSDVDRKFTVRSGEITGKSSQEPRWMIR